MNEWNAFDLHMHTAVGITGDGNKDVIKNFTYKNYVDSLEKCNIKLAAITNHNKINMVNYIMCRHFAKKRNIRVLFGVEIDSKTDKIDDYHLVAIFNEELNNCIKVEKSINELTINKKKNEGKIRFTVDELIDIIKKYDVLIVPHGDKSKGLLRRELVDSEESIKEILKIVKEGFIRIFDSHSNWKLEEIKNVIKSEEFSNVKNDFFGVLFSDNRDWKKYEKNFQHFYMNAEPTYKGLIHCITNPTERFCREEYIKRNANYISKIIIKGNENSKIIKDCEIDLKSGYNCIIGKSGSGKSLLLYIIEKILKNKNVMSTYKFVESNNIEIYNENGQLMNQDNVNIGVGVSIFNKIITASNTKNSKDMYVVINELDKNFKQKVKFNKYVAEYKNIISNYVKLRKKYTEKLEDFNESIITFQTNCVKLKSMASIKTLKLTIPTNKNYNYDLEKINKIKSIYSKIIELKQLFNYFNPVEKQTFNNKIDDLLDYYKEVMIGIINEYRKNYYNNFKKEIIRKAKIKTDKKVSENAGEKTKLENDIPENIKNLSKNLIFLKLLKKQIDNFDLSIKPSEINNVVSLEKDKDITIKEEINLDEIKKLNIKNNNIFYTRGIQGRLSNDLYDMTNRIEAKKIIDKYIDYNQMTVQCINKIFEDTHLEVNVFFGKDNIKELNPGNISKTYIESYFKNELLAGNNSIILYDQIENDVDKGFIKDTILNLISRIKKQAQLIIVTHDPIVAVNGDPINYIEASKDENGNIYYRSFVAESSIKDELVTIANTVDGSKEIIKKRYEIYGGLNNEY